MGSVGPTPGTSSSSMDITIQSASLFLRAKQPWQQDQASWNKAAVSTARLQPGTSQSSRTPYRATTNPPPCCAHEQAALQPGSCCQMGGIKGILVCLPVVIQNYLSPLIIEVPPGRVDKTRISRAGNCARKVTRTRRETHKSIRWEIAPQTCVLTADSTPKAGISCTPAPTNLPQNHKDKGREQRETIPLTSICSGTLCSSPCAPLSQLMAAHPLSVAVPWSLVENDINFCQAFGAALAL